MKVSLIPIDLVHRVWSQVGPILNLAIAESNGRYVDQDVLKLCAEGRQQLWVMFEDDVIHAAATTAIIDYPQRRALCGVFLAGDRMKEWNEPFVDMLERFAKDMGCDLVEMSGRKGWARFMKKFNWAQSAVVLEKDITNAGRE
jgi:hypothetical protein